MSSALVRQALEFVDQEENAGKKAKGGSKRRPKSNSGQALNSYTRPNKRAVKKPAASDNIQSTEDKVKRLLALSKPIANNSTAEKIISRAISGKPVIKLDTKKDEPHSILFADEAPRPKREGTKRKRDRPEPYRTFEREPFCS